uniref:Ubiquitinyl hydrolase 1 n=1 Tax=Setaria digitata TaxID=48799 RepID=A0A915PP11_9BILA
MAIQYVTDEELSNIAEGLRGNPVQNFRGSVIDLWLPWSGKWYLRYSSIRSRDFKQPELTEKYQNSGHPVHDQPHDMVLYLTKWPVSVRDFIFQSMKSDKKVCDNANQLKINVEEDEVLLRNNLHPGFVELYNDGDGSSLRIFYMENGEGRLIRECIQIAGLERAEDSSNLVFRICRLKSGIECNEHVLIKPERFKDCHTIYYAFRYLQQKPIIFFVATNLALGSLVRYCISFLKDNALLILVALFGGTKSAVRQESVVQKQTLVKQPPTFQQISVARQAYDNGKKLTNEPQKNDSDILSRPIANHYPSESLGKDRMPKVNSVFQKSNSPRRKNSNSDDGFVCLRSKQTAPDLSMSFERLSAGTDSVSPKGFLNLGNSCYMNAVLQGLFHVEAFKDLLNVVPETQQCTVLSALKTLRKSYQKAVVAKKRCLLENDAQEFLTIILDKIDSELKSIASSTGGGQNDLVESIISLSSIFGFELKHELTCNKCGTGQVTCEKGVFLPIQIVYEVNESPSLQMLLENCLKSEVVEHMCPRCNERYATMSHEFQTLPKCLIIFLKRYDFKQSSSRRQRKLKDAVKLSMCIRLISWNSEHPMFRNSFTSSLPVSSGSCDEVSFVSETPPEDLVSNSWSSSDNVKKNAKQTAIKDALERVEEPGQCDDRKFPRKITKPLKSSVIACDFNTDERMNYLTLFCLPRPDFRERSCAELNIRCHFPATRQEPKPLFWKSVPSNVAPVLADGNCLFRSIALYLSGSDEEHLIVVKFEEKYDHHLREANHFSPADWKEHVEKMTNDGEWATEVELLALAALLDAEIWTFLNGKWLRYRPLYKVGRDGKSYELPIQKCDSGKDAIFLINEDFHYKPILDIVSNGAVFDYHLDAVISHKGISPSNVQQSAQSRPSHLSPQLQSRKHAHTTTPTLGESSSDPCYE